MLIDMASARAYAHRQSGCLCSVWLGLRCTEQHDPTMGSDKDRRALVALNVVARARPLLDGSLNSYATDTDYLNWASRTQISDRDILLTRIGLAGPADCFLRGREGLSRVE